jgi:hypothetical protein
MSMLPDEFRIAARALRRSPGFTAVAVASLGLAIGVNTAVFGVVDAALFAPLPLAGAERIVRLWEERPSRGWLRFGVSAPTFRDWQERMASLAHVAAYAQRSANLAGSDRPERVRLVESTADLFAVLDVRPKLGRFFTRDEELPGRDTHDHRGAGLAALPLPVLITTARAQETQAFALVYLLGRCFLAEEITRSLRASRSGGPPAGPGRSEEACLTRASSAACGRPSS